MQNTKSTSMRLALFFIWFFTIYAGKPECTAQTNCWVHIDKSFYVTGEVMWYKIYLPSAFKGKQQSVRVRTMSASGEILHEHFLKTEGKGYAQGYYKIPFTLSSGRYHIEFSGYIQQSMTPVMLAYLTVPVYNDLEKRQISAEALTDPLTNPSTPPVSLADLDISLTVEPEVIQSRDELKVRVAVRDKNGKPIASGLSVAVRDESLTGPAISTGTTLKRGNAVAPELSSQLGNNVYVKARLFNDENQTLQANVIGAWLPVNNQLLYTKSSATGDFHLEFEDFYGIKPVQILGYENEQESIHVQLEKKVEVTTLPPLNYTKGIMDYMKFSRERKKIFQYYTNLEFNLTAEEVEEKIQKLSPDSKFRMRDYEPFENVFAFFTEILTPLRFKRDRDGNYTASMYNPLSKTIDKYYSGKPLFIVDGKVTRDAGFIATMDLAQVEEVALFFNPQKLRRQFNVLGGNGIAVFTTNVQNIAIPKEEAEDILRVKGIQPRAEFPVFTPGQIGERQPFFRPQLYWNPSLSTDSKGEATFNFHQSDDISTFQIEVVAQAEDGRMGYSTFKYKVVW